MPPQDAPENRTGEPRYLLDTVLRACDVLRSFQFEGELLRLRDVVFRTGLNKTNVYRLLQSLAKGGLIERTAAGQYRPMLKPLY